MLGKHRHQGPLGECAVADLATLRRTDATGLTGRVRREVVVVHVPLGGLRPERVDLLGHLDHVQRGDAEDLRLAALEQRTAVSARHPVGLGLELADVGDAATVDAEVVGQNALADQLLGQRPERGADLLLATCVGLRQPLQHLDLDLVGAVVALFLARDGERLAQRVGGNRGHRVEDVVAVLGEQRIVGGFLASGVVQLLLRLAQHGDERLGGLEALGHDGLGRRTRAAGDELDDVVGGLGLDHHDRDVGVVTRADDAASDDHVEHGALELLDGRERDPLAADQGDAHATDGAVERQAGDLRGRRRGVDGQHVVQVLGIQTQHRDDDLDLVAQPADERGTQRPVDEPTGQDRRRWTACPHGGRTSPECGPRRTSAPRRRWSAGRSRSDPWGSCWPKWPTAAWSRRRGTRRPRQRPAARAGRSRSEWCGCRSSRCR